MSEGYGILSDLPETRPPKRIIANTMQARQFWDRRSNPIQFLKVPMSDGTVIRYNPEITPPGFQEAIDGIRRIGYAIKEAGDAATSTGQARNKEVRGHCTTEGEDNQI